MTAATMFLAGRTRLGEDILNHIRTNHQTHIEKEQENRCNAEVAYRTMISEYNAVMALNLDPRRWTCAQLKTVLKALETKDDITMPVRKAELYSRYMAWRGRTPQQQQHEVIDEATAATAASVTPECSQEDENEDANNENEETIEAMMMLNDPGRFHTQPVEPVDKTVQQMSI